MPYTPNLVPLSQNDRSADTNTIESSPVPAVPAVSSEYSRVPIIEEAAARDMVSIPAQSRGQAICGSSHCAGCYEVALNQKIHPPKPGKNWKQKGPRRREVGERIPSEKDLVE